MAGRRELDSSLLPAGEMMQQYIARRLLLMFPVLLLVSLITFAMVRVIPGDIATLMLDDPQAGARDIEKLRAQLGLARPIYVQYLDWMWGILRGDLGRSMWTQRAVLGEIQRSLPISLELALLATLFSLIIALPAGVISAVRQDTWLDYVTRLISISGLALPAFWIGILVVTFGAIWFQWVPPIRYRPLLMDPLGNLQQFLIPSIVLGTRLCAILARMTRSSMLEVLRQDYVRTAWAKGLRERVVVFRHALRNALIPTVTILGTQIGHLIGGAVVIETIFTLPGFGRLILESVYRRDYPLIQGNLLVVAALFVLVNLIVDASYAFLDPRIRYR